MILEPLDKGIQTAGKAIINAQFKITRVNRLCLDRVEGKKEKNQG